MDGPTLTPSAPTPHTPWDRLAWSLLLAFLVGLLLAAMSYRREGGQPLADEATPLMQASSLAFEGNLAYGRSDHDRSLFRWLGQPSALHLTASTDPPSHLAFDSPALGAVWLAPFLRFWPRHGFAVANALALFLATLAAGWLLARDRHARGEAAFWVPAGLLALWLLSPVLVHVFRGGVEVLAMASAMLALALAATARQASGPPSLRRCVAIGLALALPVLLAWSHGVLVLLALGLLAGSGHLRRTSVPWGRLLTGVFAGLLLGGVVEWGLDTALGGIPFPEARGTLTPSTGFPEIDFPIAETTAVLDRVGSDPGADRELALRPRIEPKTLAWRLVDLVVGRPGGLFVYFPLVLAGLLMAVLRRPWSLGSVVLPCGSLALWLQLRVLEAPTDLYGGWVAGGTAFLPFYGAWVVALATSGQSAAAANSDRPTRRRWLGLGQGSLASLAVAGLVAVALGVAILPPIWFQPWSLPEQGPTGHWSAMTEHLPAATTQRPSESRRGRLGGLDVLVVGEGAWIEARHDRLRLAAPTELWIASPEPLQTLELESLDGGPAPGLEDCGLEALPETAVQELEEKETEDSGIVQRWLVRLPTGRQHRLVWTSGPRWVYRCTLTPGGPSAQAWAYRLLPTEPGPSGSSAGPAAEER